MSFIYIIYHWNEFLKLSKDLRKVILALFPIIKIQMKSLQLWFSNDGNRYLESNVVEHDCLSDINSISTGSVNNRSDYIPGETVINNTYGASYVFVGFAPNGGDPFGYLI